MEALDPGTTGKRRRNAASKRDQPRKKKVEKKASGASEPSKPKKRPEPAEGSPLMTIPAAGKKYFGLSRNGSYDAAEQGDFGELYELGRLKFVVVPALEAKIKAAIEALKEEREPV